MIKSIDDGYSLISYPVVTRGEPDKQQPLNPVLSTCYEADQKNMSSFYGWTGKAMPKDDNLVFPFNSSLT